MSLKERRLKFKQKNQIEQFHWLEASVCDRLALEIQTEQSNHSSFTTFGGKASQSTKDEMDKTLIPHIASLYGFGPGDLKLLDLFFVQYSNRQPELKAHRDGCLISFNILLNDPSEFDGGGTLFLPDNLVQPQKGECVVHDSRLLHAGHPITQGERKILVGFVETRDSFKFQHLIT